MSRALPSRSSPLFYSPAWLCERSYVNLPNICRQSVSVVASLDHSYYVSRRWNRWAIECPWKLTFIFPTLHWCIGENPLVSRFGRSGALDSTRRHPPHTYSLSCWSLNLACIIHPWRWLLVYPIYCSSRCINMKTTIESCRGIAPTGAIISAAKFVIVCNTLPNQFPYYEEF